MKKIITILLLAISGFASAQQMNFPDIRLGSSVTGKIAFKARFLHAPYIQDGLSTDSVLTIAGGQIKKVPRSQFSGGGGGDVNSVFGRTGDVVALSTDYSSFYPLLTSTYNNPVWINTLAYSKITGVPAFAIDADVVHKTGDETIAGDKTFSGFSRLSNMYVGNSTNNVQLTSGDIKYNIGSNLLSVYPLALSANRTQRYQNDDGTIALTKNFATGETIGANTTGSAATAANATTANTLATPRSIGLSGVTATAQNFNGSTNITIPITSVPGSLVSGNISGAATGTTLQQVTSSGNVIDTSIPTIRFKTNQASLKEYRVSSAYFDDSSWSLIDVTATNAPRIHVTGVGNVLIGSITDNGNKFQVVGSATINGSLGVTSDLAVGGNVAANNLGSGTYNPTVSNLSNISSSTPYQALYSRIGNIVTLSGTVRIATPTTGALSFQINLPIGSAFTSIKDASGTASGNAVSFGTVQANTSNGNVLISGSSNIGGVTQHDVFFTFQYIIK